MKKTYQSPTLSIVKLDRCYTLQSTSGLEGMGSYGGTTVGKSADARSYQDFGDD